VQILIDQTAIVEAPQGRTTITLAINISRIYCKLFHAYGYAQNGDAAAADDDADMIVIIAFIISNIFYQHCRHARTQRRMWC